MSYVLYMELNWLAYSDNLTCPVRESCPKAVVLAGDVVCGNVASVVLNGMSLCV